MKFKLVFVAALLLSLKSFAYDGTPEEIRSIKQAMYRSIENARVTDSLYAKLKSKPPANALMIGYLGTLEALKAKHSWNPYNKIKFVALSQKTMKEAVNRDPSNMEIRFMRFSIQHYTPSFLGFSKDLDEDLKVIAKQYRAKHFGLADKELVRNIAAFMINSKRCPKEELALFKKYV